MRWFCVAPDLPAKASLRIRAAPSSDADERGRFSKGKAVAALSEVFQLAAPDGVQHWLHVTFPDEVSGEWIEGFVMAQLANGMTLLVPWEDAGFYSCCNISSDRAVVHEGPEPSAQPVGYVGEGEGTRFPYGVREVDGHRLRIFHDVHERVWVDAADVEFVCERCEHPKCTVPHSFFALNEELPPEAQIAVRVFPSREAETRALLNRGQVIEVEMRCGSWLKIAGSPESWIMWRTDSWQLLTELPHHSSASCELANDGNGDGYQAEAMGNEVESIQTGEDNQGIHSDSCTNRDASTTPNGGGHDHDPSGDHEHATRKNSSSVTSLCDGLASHDISASDESTPVDGSLSTIHHVKSGPSEVDEVFNVTSVHSIHGNGSETDIQNPESSSWEDRTISSSQGAHDWEDRPLNVKNRAQSDHMDVEEERQEPEAVVVDNKPAETVETTPASSSWEDRPISSSRGAYDWEHQSISGKSRAPSNTAGGSEAAGETGDATSGVHVCKEYESLDVTDLKEQTDVIEETPTDEDAEETPAAEDTEPSLTTASWDDRPISASRGTYDWETQCLPPGETSGPSVPDVSLQHRVLTENKKAGSLVHVQKQGTLDSPAASSSIIDSASPDKAVETSSSGRLVQSQQESTSAPSETSQEEKVEEIPVAEREKKDWYWEEAPIKSRHARKAALNSEASDSGDVAPSAETDVPVREAIAAARAEARKAWSARRRPSTKQHDQEEMREQTTAEGESSAKLSAVGVVSAGGSSVAWHAVSAAEEPGVFEESNGVKSPESAAITEANNSSVVQYSPNRVGHSSRPAGGVFAEDSNSARLHLSRSAEDPGVFGQGYSCAESVAEADVDAVFVSQARLDQRLSGHAVQVDLAYSSSTSPFEARGQEAEDMDVEDDELTFSDQLSAEEGSTTSGVPLLCATDDEIESFNFVGDNEKLPVLEDQNPSVPIDPRDYSSRLKDMLFRESQTHLKTSRILRAIALDEGADAILEALATTGEFDEELLKYEGPPALRMRIAPSPPTAESALLDVLYSRDRGDGFSTPKKGPQGQVKAKPTSPHTSTALSKEERLASILRRTPQKATESHSKIINNAKPEDILEAEFGGCSDELGLFGDYRYPTVSTPRFSTGVLGGSTRSVSAFGSLQSPSFSSSSFNSPPPKENPLKRSASAIAKTPPVVLPKSITASKTLMTSTPKDVAQVSSPASTQVPTPSIPPPPPVRARTTSSLIPPSTRTTTGLPRPSLMSPSAATSRLRAPSTTSASNSTASVSRARSFTSNSDTRITPARPTATPSAAAPAPGVARAQSMLPRRSALQAPSPVKFGITRTNSLASSTAPPPATDAAVDPRRLSFGFSRPSMTKKQ